MRLAACSILALFPILAGAQAIERIKLTDSELTCPQIYAEIEDMNKVVGATRDERDTNANAAAAAGLTGEVTGAAVHAAAMSGSFGAAVGLAQAAPLLNLFGSATKTVASANEKASAERLADAKARKEHLTGLFVSKGCKLSDVKAAEAKPATPVSQPAAQN
jgi:hypothetical protein